MNTSYLDYIDKLKSLGLSPAEATAFNSKMSQEIRGTEFLSTKNALAAASAKIKGTLGIQGSLTKKIYPLVAAILRDLTAQQILDRPTYLVWLDKVRKSEVKGENGEDLSRLLIYVGISKMRQSMEESPQPPVPTLLPIAPKDMVYDATLSISTVIAKKQRRNPSKHVVDTIVAVINGATLDLAIRANGIKFSAMPDFKVFLQCAIADITDIDFAQLSHWCSAQSVPIGKILTAAVCTKLEQIKAQPMDSGLGDIRHIAWPPSAPQATAIDQKYWQMAKTNRPAGFAHRGKNKMRPDKIDEQTYNELEECLYWLLVATDGKPKDQYSSEIAAQLVYGKRLDEIHAALKKAYPDCGLMDRSEFDSHVGRIQIGIFSRHKQLRAKQILAACKAKNINYRIIFAAAAEIAFAQLPEKWAILPDRRNLEWPEVLRATPDTKTALAGIIAELTAPAVEIAPQPTTDIASDNGDPFKDWVTAKLQKAQIPTATQSMIMGVIDGSLIERYVDKQNPDLNNTATVIATIRQVLDTVFGIVPETMIRVEKFPTQLRMKYVQTASAAKSEADIQSNTPAVTTDSRLAGILASIKAAENTAQ